MVPPLCGHAIMTVMAYFSTLPGPTMARVDLETARFAMYTLLPVLAYWYFNRPSFLNTNVKPKLVRRRLLCTAVGSLVVAAPHPLFSAPQPQG